VSDLPILTEDERPYHETREFLARQLEQALADKVRETERANELATRLRNTYATVEHMARRLARVNEIHRAWGDTVADELDPQALWEDLLHALAHAPARP
jgi:hypothetical protein